jgi:hypothetical protein
MVRLETVSPTESIEKDVLLSILQTLEATLQLVLAKLVISVGKVKVSLVLASARVEANWKGAETTTETFEALYWTSWLLSRVEAVRRVGVKVKSTP